MGVLCEINCESDFVAKTDDFKQFVRDIAMHIAAASLGLRIMKKSIRPCWMQSAKLLKAKLKVSLLLQLRRLWKVS